MAGPRISKKGNPAATYTNEMCRFDKYQDAEGRPIAPLSVRQWSGHCISRRDSHVTHHRPPWLFGRPSSNSSTQRVFLRPQRPIVSSVGTGGVAVFNCGAPSALRIGYVLEAERLAVTPSVYPPQRRQFRDTERDLPRTAKQSLQRRHLQIP